MKDTCIHVVREQLTVCLHWCYGADKKNGHKKKSYFQNIFTHHYRTTLRINQNIKRCALCKELTTKTDISVL